MDKLRRIGSKTATYPKNDNNVKVTQELWNDGINNQMEQTLKT
jgi:hypothetical protein